MTNQIIILGFMGSGKTMLARALASRLKCLAVDLDELITSDTGRSPKEIIEEEGENRFREIETQMLRRVLLEAGARIVALGGGAWPIAENRKLIADHGAFTVWLDVPFELCWTRIESEREARPLARSRETAEELYRNRLPSYELAAARITVADNESAEEVAMKVAREFSRQNASFD